MGIFDHHRTWHFELASPPDACLDAFATSLTRGGPQLLASRWQVARSTGPGGQQTAVGTYEGRGGVVGLLTTMSRRSASEENAAAGSRMTFQVAPGAPGGRTRATLAMTATTRVFLFFTADARFFRSTMNRVARRLRSLDPGLSVTKA